MTPKEFWLDVARWGSYVTNSDPGACVYGFDERGMVENEAHRADCIAWLDETCRDGVLKQERENTTKEANRLSKDLGELDRLIAYLRTAQSLLPADEDVDDGPYIGYRRGGRKEQLAEYYERQKRRD